MKFVTDIKILTGKNAPAPDGYIRLDTDLNKGAGGDYIYLCYKINESTDVITDLFVSVSSQSGAPSLGNGYVAIDNDLNSGTKGFHIYLAKKTARTSDDTTDLFGITGLRVITGESAKAPMGYAAISIDLNRRAKGEYIYLCYQRALSMSEWMSRIDSNRSIAELSIPGTHDSLAFKFRGAVGKVAKKGSTCQDLDLASQLAVGARYFDIRVDNDCDGRHGLAICSTNLRDTLETMCGFLRQHREETILFRLMNQSQLGTHNNSREFEKKIRGIIQSFQDYIWKTERDGSGEPIVPTLGKLRGKILILDRLKGSDRYSSYADGYGLKFDCIDWEEQYKKPNVDTKQRRIEEHIEGNLANPLKLIGCGVNATGSDSEVVFAKNTPIDYANSCNPRMRDYLYKNIYRTGIVAFDFVTQELCDRVVLHNASILGHYPAG